MTTTASTPPAVVVGLVPESTYYVCIQARDANGDTSPWSASTTSVTIDTDPPTPTTTTTPQPFAAATSISVAWTGGTDARLGPFNVKACTAGDCATGCVGATTASASPQTVSGLSEGVGYYLCTQATDLAGNTAAWSASLAKVVIDTTPPTATTTTNPAAYASSASLAFAWTGGSDAHLGPFNVKACTGSDCATGCVGTTAAAVSPVVVSGLADGSSYYGCTQATDLAGHTAAWSHSATSVTVDLTPPTATTSTSPAAYSTSTSIPFAWTGGADAHLGPFNVKACTANDCSTGCVGVTTAASSPKTVTGLVNGTSYYVCTQATDLAGNKAAWSASATPVAVDTTPPSIQGFANAGADGNYPQGSTVRIAVAFNEAVTVTGTPQLKVATGLANSYASYVSGTGTATLEFDYVVEFGASSSDLDFYDQFSLAMNGGTIKDLAGNGASTYIGFAPGSVASLAANAAIVLTAPHWYPAFDLDAPTSLGSLQSVRADDGTILAAWTETDLTAPYAPTATQFRIAVYLPGSGWQASTLVTTTYQTPLVVGLHPTNGVGGLVYVNDDAGALDVNFHLYTTADGVGAPEVLTIAPQYYSVTLLGLQPLSDQSVALYWLRTNSSTVNDVCRAVRESGGGWDPPDCTSLGSVQVSAVAGAAIGFGASDLAVLAYGRTVNATSKTTVSAMTYDGSWGAETAIGPAEDFLNGTGVTVDAADDAVVGWMQFSGAAWKPRAARLSGGVWGSYADLGHSTGIGFGVAGSQNGHAIVTFSDFVSSNIVPYAAAFDPASGWAAQAQIATSPAVRVVAPFIDDNGDARVVMRDERTDVANVVAAAYTSGSGWTAPVAIDLGAWNDVTTLSVTGDGAGSNALVYAMGSSVKTTSFTEAGGWTAPVLRRANQAFATGLTATGAQPAKTAMTAWSAHDGTARGIFARSYDAGGGAWGNVTKVSTNTTTVALTPVVKFDAAGDGLAVWSEDDGAGNTAVLGAVYSHTTGWGAPVTVQAASALLDVDLALGSGGNGVVTWRTAAPSEHLHASRYVKGSGFVAPTTLDVATTPLFGTASAVDASGSAVVVWGETDGTQIDVEARYYAAGTGWDGAPARIDTTSSNDDALALKVVFDSTGKALIAASESYFGFSFNGWLVVRPAGAGAAYGAPVDLSSAGAFYDKTVSFGIDASDRVVALFYTGGTKMYWRKYQAGAFTTTDTVAVSGIPASQPSDVFQLSPDGTGMAFYPGFPAGTQYYDPSSGWSATMPFASCSTVALASIDTASFLGTCVMSSTGGVPLVQIFK